MRSIKKTRTRLQDVAPRESCRARACAMSPIYESTHPAQGLGRHFRLFWWQKPLLLIDATQSIFVED